MGAVPNADMIDVRVEKLFSCRHFYRTLVLNIPEVVLMKLTSATATKCLMTMTRLLTSACVRII